MLTPAPAQATTNDGTLSGPVDSSNKVFALDPPAQTQQEWVFRNGLLMTEGLDVATESGVATLVTAQTPIVGDVVTAAVWGVPSPDPEQAPLNVPIQFSTNDGSLIGALNGSNNVFTVNTSVLVTAIVLFFNGLMMTPDVDFTWTCQQNSSAGPWVTTITMMAGNNPQSFDVLTGQVFTS